MQFICQDERNEVIIFINGLPFVLISIFEFNSPLQSSFQAWKIINSLIDDEKFKKFSDYLHLFGLNKRKGNKILLNNNMG
ncbi:hypothetical protein BIX77_00975 [Mycoplasmoides pneumoniae]|nr:hypothetical protein BIX77_00975 [Mycoplasmoides pneumoniae]